MELTLSVDDDLVERAREVARQQGTTLEVLIIEYLQGLAGEHGGPAVAKQFEALWNEHSGHSGGWRFNRDEVYEERLGRYDRGR